jgi:hypothetical protein
MNFIVLKKSVRKRTKMRAGEISDSFLLFKWLVPIHVTIPGHNLLIKGKGGIYVSYGYPNSCCYPAPYPVYPVPYTTGGGGWYALFIVLLILVLIFGGWWYYTTCC